MSSAASQYYFRRRNIGRAASPPTWACYEQIHDDDDYSESGSESCSEDDEDYTRAHQAGDSNSDSEDGEHVVDMCQRDVGGHDVDNMDMDIDGVGAVDEGTEKPVDSQSSKDIKGKQRAIEPEPEAESPKRRHRRRQRQHMYALRPILTIQRSQGFVWNQVSPALPRIITLVLILDTLYLGLVRTTIH